MSHVFIRSALCVFISLSALCCGSDQKTSNTPDDASAEAPADTSTPQPGDAAMPAPNGQPTETPPGEPQPTSLNQATPSNAVATPKVASEPSARTQLTDSQIAMVAQLANSSEIDQAKLAQGKAKATSVKNFAAMIIKHHTESKTEQTKLFKQLDLTPTQSQSATALQQAGDATLVKLRAATSAAFDARYTDSRSTPINRCSTASTANSSPRRPIES